MTAQTESHVLSSASTSMGWSENEASLPQGQWALIDRLMRSPRVFAAGIESASPERLAEIVRTMLITIVFAAGGFGAAVGVFRPGWQILSSAIKLPMILLLTAGLATPVLTTCLWATGGKQTFLRDACLVVVTLALTALTLSALTPAVVLVAVSDASYHQMVLMVVGCSGFAGAVGLTFFLSALFRRKEGNRLFSSFALLFTFALVGTQLAWTLRPVIARPRAPFAVVRDLEGDFLGSVGTSFWSARGRYQRPSAPLPDEGQP